eukprot:3619345-Pyramimonas_sp.AAC.1
MSTPNKRSPLTCGVVNIGQPDAIRLAAPMWKQGWANAAKCLERASRSALESVFGNCWRSARQ